MVQDYHRDPPGQWRRLAAPALGGAAGKGQGPDGQEAARRRWIRWAAGGAAVLALSGCLWSVGGPPAGIRALRRVDVSQAIPFREYFRLAEVIVEGNLHLGRDDVLGVLALRKGANVLALDLTTLAARLAAKPWVKEATLQRRLPDGLVVRLVERAPAAVLVAEGAYLVSGDGVLLEAASQDAMAGLPVLRAPAGRRYAVGERVAPQELSEALGAWRQVQLAPALEGRRPREVAMATDGSYRVKMAPGSFTVRLRADGLEPQLKRLGAVVALRGGALDDVEEVDLRFPQKVILRERPVTLRSAANREARPPGQPADGGSGATPVRPTARVPARVEPPPPLRQGGQMDMAPDLRLAPRGGEPSG